MWVKMGGNVNLDKRIDLYDPVVTLPLYGCWELVCCVDSVTEGEIAFL
jgi:hypothetical protein